MDTIINILHENNYKFMFVTSTFVGGSYVCARKLMCGKKYNHVLQRTMNITKIMINKLMDDNIWLYINVEKKKVKIFSLYLEPYLCIKNKFSNILSEVEIKNLDEVIEKRRYRNLKMYGE